MTFRSSRILAGLVTFGFSGCACDDLADVGGDPALAVLDENDNVYRAAAPSASLLFGPVDEGRTETRTLTLRNEGTGPLSLRTACLVNAATLDEALANSTCLPASEVPFTFRNLAGEVIQPDAESPLDVTFSPTLGGVISFFLRIESNDPDEPVVAVQLTGRGWDGRVCLENDTIDFGPVEVGDAPQRSLELHNCGLRPVTIEAWEIVANPDDVFSFSADGSPVAAPFGPIAPDGALTVEVTFAPDAPGRYRDMNAGEVALTTSASAEREHRLHIVGDAVRASGCRLRYPEVLDFGIVPWGRTVTTSFFVESVGSCECRIANIYRLPIGEESRFEARGIPSPPTILPGPNECTTDEEAFLDERADVLEVEVEFTAPEYPESGHYETLLELQNWTNHEYFTVPVTATVGAGRWCDLEVLPKDGGSRERYAVLAFDQVPVGAKKKLPVELTNVGLEPCHIQGIEYYLPENTLANGFGLEHEDGSALNPGPQEITIPPAMTARVYATSTAAHVEPYGLVPGTNDVNLCGAGTASPWECNGVRFITDDTVSVTRREPLTIDGVYSIGFSAAPVAPKGEVVPSPADLGRAAVGCGPTTRTVRLYSTGTGDLVIDEPLVSPAGSPFSLVDSTASFPMALPMGTGASFEVAFAPTALGDVDAELAIPTLLLDTSGPTIVTALHGSGVSASVVSETFDQPVSPPLDVLFVLDDSGSMLENAPSVKANLEHALEPWALGAADYRVAVTTTLWYVEAGCSLGGVGGPPSYAHCEESPFAGHYTACGGQARFVTPATAGPAEELRCTADVWEPPDHAPNPPREMSEREAPLGAAWSFFSNHNMSDVSRNAGFLRAAADLHLILIGDEPDESRFVHSAYAARFQELKGPPRRPSRVRVSTVGIGGEAGPCATEHAGFPGADVFVEIAQAVNGHFHQICNEDWTPFWNAIHQDIVGQKRRFYLSNAADPATLSVCVRANGPDDAVCTPMSVGTDYIYDANERMIVFEPSSVPPDGARVEVAYQPACDAP